MGAPRRRRTRHAIRVLSSPAGFTRRGFLRRAGGAAALVLGGPLLSSCGNSDRPTGAADPGHGPGLESPFRHGIASGDPLQDRVILWTRVTPQAGEDIPVSVTVYRDPALSQPVASVGRVASAASDWTVKLDFTGLEPGTSYYYRFSALGFDSVTGRTRTAPTQSERLRFGVVSCSSYAHGYFNAYRQLARRADVDAVLHLGDYVYEYASDAASGDEVYGTARPYEPTHEMKTLADYRQRYAYYRRTDADLGELHRQFPFICIWDDHESCDNSYTDGGLNHGEDGKDEGPWSARKAMAQQAYDEWMPIRLPVAGDRNRIWRRFSYGNLAELFMLDTRLYDRDIQLSTPIQPQEPRNDTARRILGDEQRQWLLDGLTASSATWKLVGNQVVFHQWVLVPALKAVGGPTGLNGDSWDAYGAERQLVIDGLRAGAVDNVVLLTGDVHSSWVADITDDPINPVAYNPQTGAGSVAVEFVCTSITSPAAEALSTLSPIVPAYRALNPHIKYIDLTAKGYMILDLTPERALGEYWYVSTIAEVGGTEAFATAFPVAAGSNRLAAAETSASTPPTDPPPLAP